MPSVRLLLIAAMLAAGVTIAAACTQQPGQPPAQKDVRATEEAAIRTASVEWAKAAAAKDLDKTLSYYADEASMFPPNMPIATGPEARRETWQGLLSPPDLVFSNAATKVEAARSGDLAYEIGIFEESFKDAAGNPVRVVGKYVVVWKKQPGGQWKAVVDIFNTDQ